MNFFSSIRPRHIAIAGAALVSLAAFIARFEGTVPTAYLDPVGIPTICTGHTGTDVHVGQVATAQKCNATLYIDIENTMAGMDECLNDNKVRLSEHMKQAFTSFSFNVGVNRFCSSTMAKLINKGDYVAACNELPKWVYAQGQVLPGLVKRRKAEQELCLSS